jgi:hypothetical protein
VEWQGSNKVQVFEGLDRVLGDVTDDCVVGGVNEAAEPAAGSQCLGEWNEGGNFARWQRKNQEPKVNKEKADASSVQVLAQLMASVDEEEEVVINRCVLAEAGVGRRGETALP